MTQGMTKQEKDAYVAAHAAKAAEKKGCVELVQRNVNVFSH